MIARILSVLTAALVLSANSAHSAEDLTREQPVDGMRAYLGVLPSELLAPGVIRPGQHDSTPQGRASHHVLIALFDAKTGTRITDAVVTARVEDVGRTLSNEKRLEPMEIAGSMTFGAFFSMPGRDPYSIHVKIARNGHVSRVTFHYRHF
jgi:hypothetical protein